MTKEEREAAKAEREAMKKATQTKLAMIKARVEARLRMGELGIREEMLLLKQMRHRYLIHVEECQKENFFPTQSMALDCAEKCAKLYAALVPRLKDEDKELELVPVTNADMEAITHRIMQGLH